MEELLPWLIIALFYAPLHYLLPLLIVFMRYAEDAELRRRHLTASALDCTLSMATGFALVALLARDNLFMAMMILLGSMIAPYPRLLLQQRRTDTRADQSV